MLRRALALFRTLRSARAAPTSVTVKAERFEVIRRGKVIGEVPFTDVTKVVVYKRDEFRTDLICSNIIAPSDGGPRTWFVHEEMPGFTELMERLSALPGFNKSWFLTVAFPAFAENWTEVYRRPDQSGPPG